jgi:hypothetical protein
LGEQEAALRLIPRFTNRLDQILLNALEEKSVKGHRIEGIELQSTGPCRPKTKSPKIMKFSCGC